MADDRRGPAQGEDPVADLERRAAARVGLDVAEVADVPPTLVAEPVRRARRVVVIAGALAVGAAHVAELVDMEAVLPGREAGQLAANDDGVPLALEPDDAARAVALFRPQDRDRPLRTLGGGRVRRPGGDRVLGVRTLRGGAIGLRLRRGRLARATAGGHRERG